MIVPDSAKLTTCEEALDRAAELLRRARSLLVITGAGMSADSGLPTYRGIGGLYDDSETDEGIPIEVALSGPMFARKPELTWKYIHQIERACRGAAPNDGHSILVRMEDHFERFWLLTQNVDGFHRMAGNENVIDIHGDVRDLSCTACPHERRVKSYAEIEIPPSCPRCRAIERPRVVLFGEMLPPDKVLAMHREMARGFELILTIGTTSVFPYIAGPVLEARSRDTRTIEINPGTTEVSHVVDVQLPLRAVVALQELWQRVKH